MNVSGGGLKDWPKEAKESLKDALKAKFQRK
jgi:hypothetical protein